MKRLLATAFIGLSMLSLTLWLVLSTSGLRFIIQALHLLSSEQFNVNSIQGRLIGPINLQGLHINNNNFELKAQTVNLDWRPSSLLQGKWVIKNIHAQGIELRLHSFKQSSQASNALLKVVIIQQLSLQDISVWTSEKEPPMQIKQINLQGVLKQQQGHLQDWQAKLGVMHWQPGHQLQDGFANYLAVVVFASYQPHVDHGL
jgi:autotransporter translocation and assembly factor TamB